MEGLPIVGDGCADALHWRNLRNGFLRVSIGNGGKDFFFFQKRNSDAQRCGERGKWVQKFVDRRTGMGGQLGVGMVKQRKAASGHIQKMGS